MTMVEMTANRTYPINATFPECRITFEDTLVAIVSDGDTEEEGGEMPIVIRKRRMVFHNFLEIDDSENIRSTYRKIHLFLAALCGEVD
ncbi:hypothetical protein Sjap_022143 [Stephania japonica]|uniref:Uncharacterized protein n=1 Tax=Stephania japonica TaxID=461633 RepID=A0AAP0HU56_9MAGN